MWFSKCPSQGGSSAVKRTQKNWTRFLVLAIAMILSPSLAFCDAPELDSAVADQEAYEENSKLTTREKVSPWCNPTDGNPCTGTFGELFDHFFTTRAGQVKAWVTDYVNQAVTAGTVCTLDQGIFVEIRASGGDKTVLEQLYLSKLSGDTIWITLKSSDGTPSGLCQISFVRTLYSP